MAKRKRNRRRKKVPKPSENGNGKIEAPKAESDGGSGAVPTFATGNRDYETTRDVRMYARAVKEEWDIPEVTRKAMPQRYSLLALGKDPDKQDRDIPMRTQTTAAKMVLQMNAQNQANRPKPQQHEHKHVHASLADMIEYMEAESDRLGDNPAGGNGQEKP